jgi:uncharacterized protein DUF4440
MKNIERHCRSGFAIAVFLVVMACSGPAQGTKATRNTKASEGNEAATATQLKQMVRDFLVAMHNGNKHAFANFFDDDVIYTSSAGVTGGKDYIIKSGLGLDDASLGFTGGSRNLALEADDFTVHAYGNMAAVNFRIVVYRSEKLYLRNTATFLRRGGKWSVVAWQTAVIF